MLAMGLIAENQSGPACGIETVLDEGLARLAQVYFESGDHRTLAKVSGADFLALLAGVRRGWYCHGD